jgi:hypothetical protein
MVASNQKRPTMTAGTMNQAKPRFLIDIFAVAITAKLQYFLVLRCIKIVDIDDTLPRFNRHLTQGYFNNEMQNSCSDLLHYRILLVLGLGQLFEIFLVQIVNFMLLFALPPLLH